MLPCAPSVAPLLICLPARLQLAQIHLNLFKARRQEWVQVRPSVCRTCTACSLCGAQPAAPPASLASYRFCGQQHAI